MAQYGTIGSDAIVASTGQTFSPASSSATMKNRIINGAITIDQRSAGANTVVTDTTGTLKYYGPDRFGLITTSASGPVAIGQNLGGATPPAGFTNYLGVKSLAAFNAIPAMP